MNLLLGLFINKYPLKHSHSEIEVSNRTASLKKMLHSVQHVKFSTPNPENILFQIKPTNAHKPVGVYSSRSIHMETPNVCY